MVIIQSCIPIEDHTHWTKPPQYEPNSHNTSSSLWSLSLPAFQQYLEAAGALTFRLFLTFNSYAHYFLMLLWSTINQVMALGSLVPFHLKNTKIWMTGKKDIQKQLTFTKPIFLKVKLISSTFPQALKWRCQLTHPKIKMLLKTILFGL